MTQFPAGTLPRAAAVVLRLSPWRRRGLALLLGILSAAALPPVHLVPLLLVSFPGLIWLLHASQNRRTAFGIGWWWGLGHFSAGLYWISHAMLVDVARFGWMIPFAVLGLGGGLALFLGLVTLGVHVTRTDGLRRITLLAAAWTVQEWLRGWVLTGFPWNLFGSVWAFSDAMMQSVALWGSFGLSFITILVASLPALAAEAERRTTRRALIAGMTALALLWAGGALRLADAETSFVPAVKLRLVQASVEQANKWRDDMRQRHLSEHITLSRSAGFDQVTHVIWAETAIPYLLDDDPQVRAVVAQAVPPGGLVMSGVPRATPAGETPFKVWNSFEAVNQYGDIVGSYDKAHLVPFGEYMPLRELLPFAKITAGSTDFSPGLGAATLTLPGLPPFSPLICYEVIFPGKVVAVPSPQNPVRPAWMLNVTNDGWFGLSAGPYQHFATARLRAVEEGLPLVRAANTGISAVTDGYGRVIAKLALGQKGVLDSPLPNPLTKTVYGTVGDFAPLILVVVVMLFLNAVIFPFKMWRRL